MVTEVGLLLGDDAAAIPRTLPSESEADAFSHEQGHHKAVLTEAEWKLDGHSSHHHEKQKDQDQGKDHLTLLTSLNEQTTSLLAILASYSHLELQNPQNGSDGEDETSVLEQALVLGQIAPVLVSSLLDSSLPTPPTAPETSAASAASDFGVDCSLAVQPQTRAQAQPQAQAQTQAQAQVMVALANMGVALVKHLDRTGDGMELEEARGVYQRGIEMGMGMGRRWNESEMMERTVDFGQKRGEGMGGGVGDGDGTDDGVLGMLERLGALLDERGGRAQKGR